MGVRSGASAVRGTAARDLRDAAGSDLRSHARRGADGLRGGAGPVRAALGVSDLGGALRADRGGNPLDAGGDRGDDRWCHSRGCFSGSGRARRGSVGGRAGAIGEVGKEGEVELQEEEPEGLQEEEEQGLLLSGQRRFRRGADAPAAFYILGAGRGGSVAQVRLLPLHIPVQYAWTGDRQPMCACILRQSAPAIEGDAWA